MTEGLLFIILACSLGLFMTWGVGANDLANVMSTTMGSKAISVRQAVIIAVIFEFAGAFLASGSVTNTIRHGIINTDVLAHDPEILVYGMLAVMLGGSCWMALASYLGMPVSITHTIIGSIVGFGAVVLGVGAIHWQQVILIASSWITSPLISGVFAYLIFLSIQRLILRKGNPLYHAKRSAPYYLFAIGFILSAVTVLKGLQHFNIIVPTAISLMIACACGVLVSIIGMLMIRKIEPPAKRNRHQEFKQVEKVFSVLMLFTACAMVFAHGSNDVANAVGPMAIVVGIVEAGGKIPGTTPLPVWILALGCFGIIAGLLLYGRKIIATVGSGITALTPSRAFAATIAAATTTVVATSTGIPISATQILVGGVLGVGLARGIGALNLVVIRNIFMSWIITLPVGATFSILCFYLFKFIFTHVHF